MGKTRLAREVLGRVATERDRTEWVAATQSAAAVPLGAVAHLVPNDAIGGGRDATLRAIVGALHREQDDGRLFLGVDDAHLLDDASAALVHLLVANGSASAVATLRRGEVAPDSIVALWKDGPAALVELQALARNEVDEVTATVLDGPVEGATRHFLWESSSGNALFLHELIRHGLDSGALRRDQGLWRWTGGLHPGERLHDVVALRMGSLSDEERSTLELIAIGEPLPPVCIAHLGAQVSTDRLERRGLVVTQRAPAATIGAGETRLAHPLFGEVLRSAMPSARLDHVRLELAHALEACGANSEADQFRVTLWRVDAGDRSRPEAICDAAWRALSLWDDVTAERLAGAARETAFDLRTVLVLAGAYSRQGRSQEALDLYAATRDLPGSDALRGDIAISEASLLFFQLGRRSDAHAVLSNALRRVDDVEARRAIAGTLALVGGTDPLAADHTDDITAVSPEHALAAALDHLGAGRIERAVQTIDLVARESSRLRKRPVLALQFDLVRTWAMLLFGQVSEAETSADRAYRETVQHRADYPRPPGASRVAPWRCSEGSITTRSARCKRAPC